MKTYISPLPWVWGQIASMLLHFWKAELNGEGPTPPYLVLSGWSYSDDYNRMNTWLNCIKWAEERNCTHLIPEIPEKYWHQKEILSEFRSLEEDFGIYQKFHNASKKLTKEERDLQFILLKAKWSENFGDEYFPKRLSGKKCKRLIIKSNNQIALQHGDKKYKQITISTVNQLFDGHTIYEIDFR